ncbi:MAG: asparagine synthase (glutamine-hydrolyzing) [Legionellales bacterium]|nr:asparagine synthase (glutamine-hydrolyzing) [Legionellales bacterium]
MCGFAGIYSFNKTSLSKEDESLVSKMSDAIKHRGPDHEEIKIASERCILSHVRLSIIDVSSASNQPMVSRCGRYHIVFNGEIYNFKDIKTEFGLVTKSTGDTEVLLEAIASKGLDILPKLNGIFAFALFDSKQNTLTFARDRFGVKPAYFSQQNNKLFFSSEIKGLTVSGSIRKKFDDKSLSDFFSFLCLPEDKTFFKDIYKVRPGEVISFAVNGHKSSFIYAEPVTDVDSKHPMTTKELKKQFDQAVTRQSVSDVPLGLFLSGGVDSNGILNALLQAKIEPAAYTASYESDHASYISEMDRVDQIIKTSNTTLYKVKISRYAFWEELEKVIYHQDEPLADPVSIPVYFLSKKVSENGGKVIHVGEGADELFFGYEAWRKMELLQHLQYIQSIFRIMRISIILKLFANLGKFMPTRYAEAWRRFTNDLPLFWGGTDALTYDEKIQIGVETELLEETDSYIKKRYVQFCRAFNDNSPNKWMSYFDLKVRLPELMLMRVDKMAMANGVEARVPFLDNSLANIAWNIPITQKRNRKSMKYILKKSFEDDLDKEILYAPKKGFNAPAEEWSVEVKEKIFLEIQKFCKSSGKLNYYGIQALCEKKPRHLWRIYVLARWYNSTFNDSS